MTKLTQNFFARPSTEVAEDLLGRKMFVDLPGQGRLETILWNVGAYGGEPAKNTDKRIIQAPGTINISYKSFHYLIDICTENVNEYACVTLFGYMNENLKVEGSGRTTKFLGIDKATKIYIDGKPIGNCAHMGIYDQPELTDFQVEVSHPEDKGENILGMYYIE